MIIVILGVGHLYFSPLFCNQPRRIYMSHDKRINSNILRDPFTQSVIIATTYEFASF